MSKVEFTGSIEHVGRHEGEIVFWPASDLTEEDYELLEEWIRLSNPVRVEVLLEVDKEGEGT